ncbi:MAG: response regulator transcription factor [Myxococcota bacterium]|jgi:DNA-binding response OmpR family regulator|nr:response regulator transcription factor [Myxococcota bacterium]
MRILVAEDDRTSRDLLLLLLERAGHEVVVTVDGRQAWNAAQAPDAPKLLILDWMMPELSGPELCKRLRALSVESPPYIILLTALSEKRYVAEGLDAGANDYLSKPVDPLELRARVDVGERMLKLHEQLVKRNQELQDAMTQIRTLHGIIPICCHCKRILDDHKYWRRIEEYITEHTDALFSHDLCPECELKYYSNV